MLVRPRQRSRSLPGEQAAAPVARRVRVADWVEEAAATLCQVSKAASVAVAREGLVPVGR